MKPDEKIVLFLTFLTGMFGGAFLYVTSFAPQYDAPDVAEQAQIAIVGQEYGGCDRGGLCATFRLTDDRSYQFLVNENRREGVAPKQLANDVFAELQADELARLSEPMADKNCGSYVDRLDYTYTITTPDGRYVLDTCTTVFDHDTALGQALLELWQYVLAPEDYQASSEENRSGFSGWFIEQFQGEE